MCSGLAVWSCHRCKERLKWPLRVPIRLRWRRQWHTGMCVSACHRHADTTNGHLTCQVSTWRHNQRVTAVPCSWYWQSSSSSSSNCWLLQNIVAGQLVVGGLRLTWLIESSHWPNASPDTSTHVKPSYYTLRSPLWTFIYVLMVVTIHSKMPRFPDAIYFMSWLRSISASRCVYNNNSAVVNYRKFIYSQGTFGLVHAVTELSSLNIIHVQASQRCYFGNNNTLT